MRKAAEQVRRLAIVPQEITVSAPPALVAGVIGAADLAHTALSINLLSRDGNRSVVAFSTPLGLQEGQIIKEMVARGPHQFTLSHLTGPFAGAVEDLRVSATAGGGARVVASAEFEPGAQRTPRLLKLTFEHAVQRYLLAIKDAAEARTGPLNPGDVPVGLLVSVPAIVTEAELIAAIQAQEEAEWGHVGHGRGVERVALSLAEAVMLPTRQIELLRRAALLHDAGKLALDSTLWGTRGTLAASQRAMMEAHARLGAELAERIGLPDVARSIILHHHERWDGRGYPDQLAGEAIPLRARILFLAEVVDSMLRSTYRRAAMTPAEISAVLEAGAGTLWDPMLARKAARIVRGRFPEG